MEITYELSKERSGEINNLEDQKENIVLIEIMSGLNKKGSYEIKKLEDKRENTGE